MTRRQFEVGDEVAYKWSERRRQGDSYSKIARDEGVDRRVVARVLMEFNRQGYLDEGSALRRGVRAELFRAHLDKLEKASWQLLRLIAELSPEEGCSRPRDDNTSTSESIESLAAATLSAILAVAPMDNVVSVEPVQWKWRQPLFHREAKAVIADLKAHLPRLWEEIEGWESAAAAYRDCWTKMNSIAGSKGIAAPTFESGLQEGLRFLSMSRKEEEFPPYKANPHTPQEVGLWLYRNAKTRDLLEAYRNSCKAIRDHFARLEGMVIPSELRHSLLDKTCDHCPLP